METYKIPIEFAFILFPFIAFILTIPFLLHQYRKYGAIPIIKSLCFYSFILYLLCAYFLVILPLPSIETVSKMSSPKTQLKLFQFIKDILSTINYDISNFNDILRIIKQPTVYIVLFNFILTLPFGVYIRYIFKKNWYQTLGYTFLLSLFFELTQLSGLYGIYPRPYRLFDVDDLLINSVGGLIGYIIAPALTSYLPTKEQIEENSYKKGEKVTLLRRCVSSVVDFLFLLIFCLILKILFYGTLLEEYYALITITIYLIILPSFTSGKTIGKKMLRLKIVGIDNNIKWPQILFRNILLIYFIVYPFAWIDILADKTATDIINRLWIVIAIYQIINIAYYIFSLSKKEHIFLYERITNSKNISTITSQYLTNTNELDKQQKILLMSHKEKKKKAL